MERCVKCNKEYIRNFVISQPQLVNMSKIRQLQSEEEEEEESIDDKDDETDDDSVETDDEQTSEQEKSQQHYHDSKLTGRKCECGGSLSNTIVNFGEKVGGPTWKQALPHAKKADLMIVLGSSLKVSPAAELVEIADKIVICNLQKCA